MSLSRHGGLGSLGDPLGLSGGLSSGLVVSAPAANPNLLLWTDSIDNAVWTKTASIISADQDGVADGWASTGTTSAVRQISTTAASTGSAATATMTPGQLGAYVHGEVSGTFDGTLYTFSMEAKDTGAAAVPSIRLRIDISGGFLRCSLEDPAGDGDYLVQHLQLQVGAFTSYHSRGGT